MYNYNINISKLRICHMILVIGNKYWYWKNMYALKLDIYNFDLQQNRNSVSDYSKLIKNWKLISSGTSLFFRIFQDFCSESNPLCKLEKTECVHTWAISGHAMEKTFNLPTFKHFTTKYISSYLDLFIL